jgi:hypothetical protein
VTKGGKGNFAFLTIACFFRGAMTTSPALMFLPAAEWRARAEAHHARAAQHTGPARERRDRGLPHPIEDFLFGYYPFSFSFLENWQPGTGIALEWDDSPLSKDSHPFTGRSYVLEDGAIHAESQLLTEKERQRLAWISALLKATRDRAPNFACHGLHEWAMVYRGRDVRHEKTLKMRLSQAEIDAVVESRAICCSHHDAFRFFAKEARPLNHLQPDLETRILLEQPGCLHANMDLYKWAAKAMPWTGSELLLDCFELATDLRDLDMRASPYDLTDWGREPVCIETAEGRRVYENEQRQLAARAQPLRGRLIAVIGETLALANSPQTPCQPSF